MSSAVLSSPVGEVRFLPDEYDVKNINSILQARPYLKNKTTIIRAALKRLADELSENP